MTNPVLFSLSAADGIEDYLCRSHGLERGRIDYRRFPDGETYLRLETPVEGREVVLLCSLDRPDEKTLPLLFMAAAARQLGATRVGLIAPYLAYMRQDRAFQEGEAVTSTAYARVLSDAVDWLITVDPHLHRHPSLSSIYSIPASAVSAAVPIATWLGQHISRPFLIGPDDESAQWVFHIAELARAASTVLHKTRHGDFNVDISPVGLRIPADSTPVVIDDIISSARTMMETVRRVREGGRSDVVCIGVHAIFAGDAYDQLIAAGAARIVTANTVNHATNAIDVSDELGTAVAAMLTPASGGPPR